MTQIKKLFFAFFLQILIGNVNAATFSAQVDVNPVLLSDSFQLTYTAEGTVDDDPDFSAISHDFEILGTSQSNNITMINGDFQRTKKWSLSLRAKNSGTFRIPAISFGNEQAPEVEIIVKEVPTSAVNNPTQDFIVELESSTKSVFIQQQVLITARLLVAQNISSYQFSDLRTDNSNTIIEQIGKDKKYRTYRGSKLYIIIEKQFSLFPQKIGKLKVEPFVAEIGVIRQNSRRNIFDPFNSSGSTKRIQSNNIELKIKPIPKSFTNNNWLPTRSLKLIENWPQQTEFFVGEPITRTITLIAEGLSATQLPEIQQTPVNNIKQYPDKPISQDTKTTLGISSTRKQKIALIPTVPGTYTLPALDIPWWNTKTNKIDTAHISPRKFTVLPSPLSANNQYTQQSTHSQKPTLTTPSITNKQIPLPNNVKPNDSQSNPIWLWLSFLFLLLWLLTIFLWWRSKKQSISNSLKENLQQQSLATSLKYLKLACAKNNPNEVKTTLLKWANILFPHKDINNLTELADMLGEPVSEIILSLNVHLYGSSQTDWQCGELYTLCQKLKVDKNHNMQNKNSAELEDFNRA